MKAYLAQIKSNLRLMARDRAVIFFGYLFPLIFFFLFGRLSHAEQDASAMAQVIAMVMIIGILGNGFMGAGMRTVQDRETNVLRRFKVAPISALPLIAGSIVAGLVNFLPLLFLLFVLARAVFAMPVPSNLLSLLAFAVLGIAAFRSLGMVIAAVVNSAQEAQILVQLLYLPMLFLSGATFPLSMMPSWVQSVAQFLPATYLFAGTQAILVGHESFFANWFAAVALLLASALSIFVALKLFRWEKEEKISGRAKLWIIGVLAPFLLAGIYQARTKANVDKARILATQANRNRAALYTNARIFVGDGLVIPNGAVLIRNGRIERVYDSPPQNANSLGAEIKDETGRTLIPGLIDMHVHLGAPGGLYKEQAKYADPKLIRRRLAAYLYCGITAVRSVGDRLDSSLALREAVRSGDLVGAELFSYGPLFTAPGGHPSELLAKMPAAVQASANQQFLRTPKDPTEAQRQVDALKRAGVDGIKAVLEAGYAEWQTFPRLQTNIYSAVIQRARQDGLPSATHTGSSHDVQDAIAAGTNSIEHGSMSDMISPALFAAMKTKGIAYDPTLSMMEAIRDVGSGQLQTLQRPLLRRAAPSDLLSDTQALFSRQLAEKPAAAFEPMLRRADQNLRTAYHAGVALIAGSDAGNMLIIHGPTVQHELELWVKAGVPPGVALQAATYGAARVLRAEERIGSVKPGREASFILLAGDPVQDIVALERIESVVFRGEELDRSELLHGTP